MQRRATQSTRRTPDDRRPGERITPMPYTRGKTRNTSGDMAELYATGARRYQHQNLSALRTVEGRMQANEEPYKGTPLHDGDEEIDEERDDAWTPPRLPSSTRRYQGQGLPDIRTIEERVRALPLPANSARVQPPGGNGVQSNPNGASSGSSTIPPCRSAMLPDLPGASRSSIAGSEVNRTSAVQRARTDQDPVTQPEKLVVMSRKPAPTPVSPAGHIQKPRVHWLLFVGLGMLTMVAVWIGLTFLTGWWQVVLDDWHYGRPRTYQVDAVVGHHDSVANPSHFIALNLNHYIEIIEFPGGNPTQAKVYIGPILLGSGQDLTVVTLTFKDLNGDGRPDMVINIDNSHFVFINDNGQFRPARPGEVGS